MPGGFCQIDVGVCSAPATGFSVSTHANANGSENEDDEGRGVTDMN